MTSNQSVRSNRNRHLLPLVAWTVLCLLFFGTIILGVERLPAGDFTAQFHAFGTFQAKELGHGRLPRWLPASYGGVRFAGDPQAAVFYLPRLISILASLPWEFPLYALELEAIAHVWLAGAFTYALAFSITRQRLAALLAGVAFGLGGYLTSYPVLQLAILETVAWLPLALFLLREGVSRSRDRDYPLRMGWYAGAALVLALSLTAGHPQTFVHASYVAGAYYLFLVLRARWSWKWVLGLGGLITIIVAAGSAAMWLPAIQTWGDSTRRQVGYQFVSSGLPLLNFLQALVPASLSFWSPEYLGVGTLALIALAWQGRGERNQQQRAETIFWACLALGAAWLALGDDGVLYQLAYHVAPGFSFFRQQERLLSVVSLSGAILASQGLAYWLSLDKVRRLNRIKHTALLISLGMLAATLTLLVAGSIAADDWPSTAIRQLGIALVAFCLLAVSIQPRLQATLLVLLLAADLYMATYSGISRQPGSPAGYWQRPDWLETLLADYRSGGVSRLDSTSTFAGNYGAIYDWDDLSGISPIKPSALVELNSLTPARRWQLLNVSHVLATSIPQDVQASKLVDIDTGLDPDHQHTGSVYRLEASLDRAWMSYHPVLVNDQDAALVRLGDPALDPAISVIFHTPIPEAAALAPPPESARPAGVTVSRPQPGQLHIDVDTQSAGFLVISEWHEPGWRATIDGKPTTIYPADYALQAIHLPAGFHEVNLAFRPVEVEIGLALSTLTLAGAGLLAWRWRRAVTLRSDAKLAVRLPPRLPISLDFRSRRKRGKLFWLWVMMWLTLLSFTLRVFRIDDQELRDDEAFSYLFASQPAGDMIPALIDEGDPHPPLHYLTLHGWMVLAGDSELALRYMALAAGLLMIPLMYQLGRMIGRRGLGILLAFLTAISPSLIWISQDVRNQYVIVQALSLLATILVARLVRKPAWIEQVSYLLACSLIVYTHYCGGIVLMAHGLYVLANSRGRRIWLTWLGTMAVAFLSFLPWVIAIAPTTLAAGQLGDPSHPDLGRHLVAVGAELAAGPVWQIDVARWFFVVLTLIALFGLVHVWHREKPLTLLLMLWLVGTAIGLFFIRFLRATFSAFYITVAAPAWWALVGAGLWSLWRRRRAVHRLIVVVSLVALVGTACIGLTRYYFEPAYSRTCGYRETAGHLAQDARAGDLFLAHFPDPSLDYYLRDLPLPRTMQPAAFPADEEVTNENMAQLAARYARLWFVPTHNSNWDPTDSVFRWLDYHMLLEQQTHHDRLVLAAYRPLASADEVMTRVEQTAGESLQLGLAYLTVGGQPQAVMGDQPLQIQPGADLEVSCVWQAVDEIDQDYVVFVHLLDENRQIVAQHDGTPATGTRPTTGWLAEEPILDKHRLTVPETLAPGQSVLVVGLYAADTLVRLPFSDGTEYIVLCCADWPG